MEDAIAKGNDMDAIKYRNYAAIIEKKHLLLLMEFLTFYNVDFIVAPYEADAQLAYMHKLAQIDYVITEDSDLVLYSCPSIINKLNQSGYCELLRVKDNGLMYTNSDTQEVEEFVNLTEEQRIWMSIMVGCDYLEKVRGVGIKKGIMITKECNTLPKIFKLLKERMKRFKDTKEYKNDFQRCGNVFKYQMVYNSVNKELTRYMIPDAKFVAHLERDERLYDFVGREFDNVDDHITGRALKNAVPIAKRIKYDFRKIEQKANSSNYSYCISSISNLISGVVPEITVKDDMTLGRKSRGIFGGSEDIEEEENSDCDQPKELKKNRFSGSTSPSGQARSKSYDLGSPNTLQVSTEELKEPLPKPKMKNFKSKFRKRTPKKKHSKKESSFKRAQRRKFVAKQPACKGDEMDIFKTMLDTEAPISKKVAPSNVSTKDLTRRSRRRRKRRDKSIKANKGYFKEEENTRAAISSRTTRNKRNSSPGLIEPDDLIPPSSETNDPATEQICSWEVKLLMAERHTICYNSDFEQPYAGDQFRGRGRRARKAKLRTRLRFESEDMPSELPIIRHRRPKFKRRNKAKVEFSLSESEFEGSELITDSEDQISPPKTGKRGLFAIRGSRYTLGRGRSKRVKHH